MKAAVLGIGGMGRGAVKTCLGSGMLDEVIAYDVDPAKFALMKQEGIVATTSTSLDAVLADPEVQLVFITASNDAHCPLALAALKAGKAVMCEKPMATSLADAKKMVEAAEKRKLFFQIGFELRYSKLYTSIKDWVDQGLLGQVMNTHCYYICSEFHQKGSWRNKLSSGGGMFGEKLSHYVDLPRWWIGSRVTEVYSACAPNVIPYYEVRDNYHTTYRFENGAVSHLTFHMAVGETFHGDPLQDVIDQQKEDGHALRYLVVGTKGAAAADVFFRQLKRWEFGDSPQSMTSKWVENLTWDKREDQSYYHNTHGQNLDIIRRVRDGLPPATPARDAYETMRLVDAAERSADTGRIITLRRQGTRS